MQASSDRPPYAIAIIVGSVLWAATAALGGRAEPWDTPIYWTAAYPLSIVVAAVLGYAFPRRAWRWGLTVTYTQVIVMVLGGAGIGLLPLGLVMLTVLSAPAVLAATIAASVALRPKAGAE